MFCIIKLEHISLQTISVSVSVSVEKRVGEERMAEIDGDGK